MTRIQRLFSAVLLSLAVFSVQAVELAISAEEAYAKTQQTEQPVLLVDVRDPVEIMFIGFADAMIASGLMYALEKEGYRALHCKDLKAAKEALLVEKFDLAILDMQLPDGIGFEINDKLKTEDKIM